MSEAATLMFGLGTTRSGSTWLYRYLAGHPDCALPRIKELHYFSTLDLGGRNRQIKRLDGIINRAERRLVDAQSSEKRRSAVAWHQDAVELRSLLADKQENIPGYLEYLCDGREGRVHGDMSPAYALLSKERLSMMAGLAERVRFVLFLRDPVDRLWSNICQTARFKAQRGQTGPADMIDVAKVARKLFDRWLGGLEVQLSLRCDYQSILSRVKAVIPEGALFLGYYERLFRSETISKLCAFLGISDHPADFERRANSSDKLDMTPAQRAKAQAELRDQYDYVDSMMGGDLPSRWHDNRLSATAGQMRV